MSERLRQDRKKKTNTNKYKKQTNKQNKKTIENGTKRASHCGELTVVVRRDSTSFLS